MKATLVIVLLSLLAISFFAQASELDLDAYVDAELVEELYEEENSDFALLEQNNFMVAGSTSSHDSISEEEFVALIEEGRAYALANPAVKPGSALATATAKGYSIKVGKTTFNQPKSNKPVQAPLLSPDLHFTPERTNMTYKIMKQLNPGQKLITGSFATEYQYFKVNYNYAYQLNTRFGHQYNRKPFKSTGPYGGWSTQTFKKKIRNTKSHKGYKSKNGVYKRTSLTAAQKKVKPPSVKGRKKGASTASSKDSKKATSASKSVKLPKTTTPAAKKPKTTKKGGHALVELEQAPKTGGGGRVGGSGGSSQKSGKTGGTSGGDAQKSGKTGGTSGEDAQKSGKTGGADGSTVDKSGKTGGAGAGGAAAGGAPWKPLTKKDIENSMIGAGVNAHDYLMATGVLEEWPTYDKDVLDQGTCGSCWAQTAANNIFTLHFKYFPTESVDKPSVQQLLDCVNTELSHGCDGGTPMDALRYMQEKNFAEKMSYPMLPSGGVGTCRPSSAPVSATYKSWGWSNAVPPCTVESCPRQQLYEMELLKIVHVDNLFPIVYVDSSNFQLYSGGIFPTNLCSSTLSAGDHVMELISYYTDENTGVPYWIVRNSWGANWGEQGFIKLPFGVNACGLANFAVLATPKPAAEQMSWSDAQPTYTDDGKALYLGKDKNAINPHSRAAIDALG